MVIDKSDGGSGEGTAAPFGVSGAQQKGRPIVETDDEPVIEMVRMKRRADFLACRNGARVSREAFGIQLRKRKPDETLGPGEKPRQIRVGFTVTKKIGNAVIRNRIKRRLRAASAQIVMPGSLTGHDLVFMANEPAFSLPFDALMAQMQSGLTKALERLQNPPSRGKTRRDEGRARERGATGAGRR